MLALHPQFVTDSHGKKTAVILPIEEFSTLIAQLEELQDIRIYDEAKQADDGKRISFSDYLKARDLQDA